MSSAARRSLGGITILLVVLVLLGLVTAAVPFFLVPPAALELRLRDGLFDTDLTGLTVRVLDLDKGRAVAVETSRDSGQFLATIERIRSGEVYLEVTAERFDPAEVRVSLPPLRRTRSDVVLVPNFGFLEISVVDARDPDYLVTAEAAIRVDGDSAPTRENVLRIPADPGLHDIGASASGFCPGEREVQVQRGETSRVLVPLPPELAEGERARVILDWAEDPQDLDAHVILSGHSKKVRSLHTFFKNKEGKDLDDRLYAKLDVDWMRSEGFETITVYDTVHGVFQYFVHHFSGSGTLGGSAATVEIVTGDCDRRQFTVPEPCAELFWYVADLNASAEGVLIIERGQCQGEIPVQWKQGKADG